MKFLRLILGLTIMVNVSVGADPPTTQPGYTSFYTGQIKAIGKGTLDLHVLRGHSGIIHPVNVDEKTQIVLLSGKAGQLTDLKVGQWIKVYWNPDPSDPKQQRIVKIEPGMSPLAVERLTELETKAASLDVSLQVTLDAKGSEEELHFLGPDADGGFKEPFFARLSKDEMGRLLRYLALDGFLADAHEPGFGWKRTPAPPCLLLSVGGFTDYWHLGPEMMKRLEGFKTALPEKAAAKLDKLLDKVRATSPIEGAAAGRSDLSTKIEDLSSDDGKKRVAATAALFEMGKDALEPLKKAGAKQVSPFGTIQTRRIDIVYSLIEGLQDNPPGARAGYTTNGFGLRVEAGCTQEDVIKLGEKYGFTLAWAFQADALPSCYVRLAAGKRLADVLKTLLVNEPQIITANLNYFEK